jgi:hypothetical protein
MVADFCKTCATVRGMLVKSSGFSLFGIIMLAAGIGANTVVFSVVNAVLLKPLPLAQLDELVSLYTSHFSGPSLTVRRLFSSTWTSVTEQKFLTV